MEASCDVLVCGAGPAGSATALLLARAGWDVVLVERAAFPRRKVCGECVAASNLPLLAAWGVAPVMERKAGAALRRVAFACGAQHVEALLPAAAGAHAWGRALGREFLDAALLEQVRAQGVRVWQPWTLTTLEGAPGAWRAAARSGTGAAPARIRARLVVDARGTAAAPLTGGAGRGTMHRPSDLLAFKANFTGVHLAPDLLPVLALPGGYGGMVIAGEAIATVACCVRRDMLVRIRGAAPPVSAGLAVEAWLRGQCALVGAALAQARRAGPWLAAGPVLPGVHLRADDRVLRVGNAAGESHPILGEGISMALQSAALLCAAVQESAGAGGGDVQWQARLARLYARRWRARFGLRLRLARIFAHAAMHPAAAGQLLAVLRRAPWVLTAGARWGGKTQDCRALDPRATAPAACAGARPAGRT